MQVGRSCETLKVFWGKLRTAPCANLSAPRPKEQGSVSPVVSRGSEGSEAPSKEPPPSTGGTKREHPSDSESVLDRFPRQRTEESLWHGGGGPPSTALASGMQAPLGTGGLARRASASLASVPPASSAPLANCKVK
jgi:hypothetical protein